MQTRMNAVTADGERVVIVEKEITDGARPHESQILTSEDGRTFRPCGGGQVEEITIMDDVEAPAEPEPELEVDPADVEVPAPDAEQAAEAPAAGGDEEGDEAA